MGACQARERRREMEMDKEEKSPASKLKSAEVSKKDEQLLEENRQLQVTVEELRKENRRVKKCLKTSQQKYKKAWKGMRMELAELRKEEKLLDGTVDNLKKTLGQGTSAVGSKLKEIRELTKKVEELKSGKTKKSEPLKKVEQVNGEQVADQLFPEEVWRIIFGEVSDPKDLWNLCNTCPLFHTILFPWKTGWMLKQALPYLYQYLSGEKLMECRLVCKSWQGAVDHFLEDHPSLRPHDPETHEPRYLDIINPMKEKGIGESCYDLTFNHQTMRRTDNHGFGSLEDWNKTRMIGRVLYLRLGNITPNEFLRGDVDDDDDGADEVRVEENAVQMWEKFYQFLNSFGKEVWTLNLQYGHDPDETDGGIREWDQKLLPFLTTDLFRIFPELRKLSIVQKGERSQVPILLASISIPPAPKLETFQSDCYGEGIGTAILPRYHTQLRCLSLSAETWRVVQSLNWPNLKELHLNSFFYDGEFRYLWGGRRLPQLTKLGMNLELINDTGVVELGRLLRALHELSAIAPLSCLRLEGLGGLRWGKIKGCRHALSNVKTVEFEHREWEGHAPIYHFLLHAFPLLENLNLFIRDLSYFAFDHCPGTDLELLPWKDCEVFRKPLPLGREHEIVEVNKFLYERAMYRSNIWEVMPLLKVFSFQWDVYTRHEYEAMSDAQGRAEVLANELEEFRTLVEQADLERRSAEEELADAQEQLNDLGSQAASLFSVLRKLESELQTLHADQEEIFNEAKSSDEKVKNVTMDAAQTQEKMRKQMELQMKDLQIWLSKSESNAPRGGTKLIAKLEERVRALEKELDGEQRRHADCQKNLGENERRIQALSFQADEDRKNHERMQGLVDKIQQEIKTYKRHIEEAEKIAALNLAKQDLEEAEERSGNFE